MVYLPHVWLCSSYWGCYWGNHSFYLYSGIWGPQTALWLGGKGAGISSSSQADRICKALPYQCCHRQALHQKACRRRHCRRLGWSAPGIHCSSETPRFYTGIHQNVCGPLRCFQGQQLCRLCNAGILYPRRSEAETSAYDGCPWPDQAGDRQLSGRWDRVSGRS